MSEEAEKSKEINVDVHMNSKVLYDFLLNHAYSGASGILGTCFGFLGVLFFIKTQYPLYLLLGVILILYYPVNLRYKAALLMQSVEAYKQPLHYLVNEDGITVSQGETTENVTWEQCVKAVSTKKSILIYTGKRNATIFPREDLQEYTAALIAVIAENMEPQRVKIRY